MTKDEVRKQVKAVVVDLYTAYDEVLDIGKNSGDDEIRCMAYELGNFIEKLHNHVYKKEA